MRNNCRTAVSAGFGSCCAETRSASFHSRHVQLSARRLRVDAGRRLLHDPDVHSERAHRRIVVGVVLDQHRRRAGAHLARRAHHPDHDDADDGHDVLAASGLLHQGDLRQQCVLSMARFSTA